MASNAYEFSCLKTWFDGATLVLSFNRPDRLNAINDVMEREFYTALRCAENDPEVRAVLLKGEGRLFSPGHDIHQCAVEMIEERELPQIDGADWMRTGELLPPWRFSKPLVAAVHGFVGPHANAIILNCDFVIAAKGTRFSFEAAQVMSTGVPYGPYTLLPLYFPIRALKKLWLAGGWMDADQAMDLYYVQRVVAHEDLEAEALRHCRYLAGLPNQNYRDNKTGIHRMYEIWGLLAMGTLGRDPYAMGEEETEMLKEHFMTIYRDGVRAAVSDRDDGVEEEVSRL